MSQSAVRSLKPAAITNAEIEGILAMRKTREALKAKLERMDEALAVSEAEILGKLDRGADLLTVYSLRVKIQERRFPAWKEEFLAIAGKAAADAVLARTPAKIYRNLVIE